MTRGTTEFPVQLKPMNLLVSTLVVIINDQINCERCNTTKAVGSNCFVVDHTLYGYEVQGSICSPSRFNLISLQRISGSWEDLLLLEILEDDCYYSSWLVELNCITLTRANPKLLMPEAAVSSFLVQYQTLLLSLPQLEKEEGDRVKEDV